MTFIDILLQLLHALPGNTAVSKGAQISKSIKSFIVLNPRSVVKPGGCNPIRITTKYNTDIAQ